MQESVTQERWKYIGGSDIPAIMGISPFVKRMELLRYKAQIDEPSFTGNEYTEYGNVMEPKIRDYVNAGVAKGKFVEDKIIVPQEACLAWRYHSDGFNEDERTVLEIKTTSQVHSDIRDYRVYLVQLLFGMLVHTAPFGMLAVYARPEDMSEEFDEDRLQIFDVKLPDYATDMEQILYAINDFNLDLGYLKEHKDAEENELPSRKSLVDISRQSYVVAGKEYEAYFLLMHEKDFKDAIAEIKAKLLKAMEERGVKSAKFGNGTSISYVPAQADKTVESFDLDTFKSDHPDLYEKYLTLKPVKGKASYVTVRRTKH